MIRFIHTADIHFGMENYGQIDPVTGIHSRLVDFVRALNVCIDHAINESVDFFLFCGDAYKTHNPSQTQQRMLLDCFLRLYYAKIPVIIVVGNHDHPLSFGKAHALNLFDQLPLEGFYVVEKPAIIRLETKSGLVNIVGIPWPTRNTIALDIKHQQKSALEITQYIAQGVAAIIQNFASQLDPSIPAVLASHMTVSNGIFSGSEKRAVYGTDPILLPSQLAIQPFDYVALGHLHRYQNLNPNGYPAVVYSGSIERVDFGERKEDKGFCDVIIHEKGRTTHEHLLTPMRPFIQIEVRLKEGLLSQTDQVIDAIKEYDIANAVIKIIYHVPVNRADVVDLKLIEKACAAAHYIVGIFPVIVPTMRLNRGISQSLNLDMETLLERYFDNKKVGHEKTKDLMGKSFALLQEDDGLEGQ